MKAAAIITAAGRGSRAGGEPKQWQSIGNRSVLERAVAPFLAMPEIARVIVVLHADDMPRGLSQFGGRVTLVAGGNSRMQSVRNALQTIDPEEYNRVLIHDGARPLVRPELIRRVLSALAYSPAAAAAMPVSDALWRGEGDLVAGLIDRAGLFRAQTPQGFRFPDILDAHLAFQGLAKDDVEIARAAGMNVAIVPGEATNMKITWPADFARAERLLDRPVDFRTGNGFDVHALGPGSEVTLCGVSIPHSQGLIGHSDADVGIHALCDAIYGALAEGDIGRHFPCSDARWKGVRSAIFLTHAAGRIAARGFRLSNADVTLICEAPKIAPHAGAMAAALAESLGCDAGRIGIKATTSEGLGFTGRREGIAAMASVALISP